MAVSVTGSVECRGVIGHALAMPAVRIGHVVPDAHALLRASLLCGYQSVLFAIFANTFAVNEGLIPEDDYYRRFFRFANLERGLIIAILALMLGVALLLVAVDRWRLAGFGNMDYAQTMRLVVPGATLTALGFQTILSSFLVSILGMQRR
jgi:hypothetical protein